MENAFSWYRGMGYEINYKLNEAMRKWSISYLSNIACALTRGGRVRDFNERAYK
jgi:hypothetical protein